MGSIDATIRKAQAWAREEFGPEPDAGEDDGAEQGNLFGEEREPWG